MQNEINWEFVKGCDRVIAEHALNDWKNRKNKRSRSYSLSANTQHLQDVKMQYINGEIDEESAKATFLRQRLCGNVI